MAQQLGLPGIPALRGSSVSSLLGGSTAISQIAMWTVLAELANAVLQPALVNVQNAIWPLDPSRPLSPADLADAVVRGHMDRDTATAEAAKSGIDKDPFAILLANTGEPPGIEQLLFAHRRKIIDTARLVAGIRQSRVRDEWIDVIEALSFVPLTASDAVDAAVENQIPRDQAVEIARQNGITEADFEILFNSRGRPPGPQELIELTNRGIIPETGTGPHELSLEQGISESAIKDKWIPAYYALREYLPPPRTVTALERDGAITREQAQALYVKHGLSVELAAAYAASASHAKLATDKKLAKDTVLQLYHERVISDAQVHDYLAALGYHPAEAQFLIDLTDLQRSVKAVNSAVSKISSLYIGHKIGRTDALNDLNALAIPPKQVDELIQTWDLEREANVRIPSEAQIAAAMHYQIITLEDAIAELQNLGYSAYDAWLVLSVHEKAPLGAPPPK